MKHIVKSLLLVLLWSTSAVIAQVITAEITSCPGWKLNSLPIVKRFLKGGEAESYQGVKINWIRGRKPVMAIFKDGVQQEEFSLADYNSSPEVS